MKALDEIMKKSILTLNLNPDTKTQITTAEIQKFAQELKRISSRKAIVAIVIETS